MPDTHDAGSERERTRLEAELRALEDRAASVERELRTKEERSAGARSRPTAHRRRLGDFAHLLLGALIVLAAALLAWWRSGA